MKGRNALLLGGALSFGAALAHLGIVFGGPDWYRAFGAGEELARLAEQGSSYPALVTVSIALMLAACGAYALSAASVLPRLPLLDAALAVIAGVFLLRGIAGIPVVLWVDAPHAVELRGRMTFMVMSSLVSLGIGLCYAAGFALRRRAARGSGG